MKYPVYRSGTVMMGGMKIETDSDLQVTISNAIIVQGFLLRPPDIKVTRPSIYRLIQKSLTRKWKNIKWAIST